MKLENYSKGLFLICGIILIIVGVPKLFLNNGLPYSNYLLFLALILFSVGLAFSYKIILDFFTMRTTKYGFNMGTLIFLGAILYFCLNFFAFRYDVSVDITGDKVNSLSLQSLEILDSLKENVEFKVYYQGKAHLNQNIALKGLFKKYLRESAKVKTAFIDAHKDPSSSKYLDREDKGKLVVFVKKGERLERVREPMGEEAITSALFRLGRTDSKKIYFLTGHGERSLKASSGGGAGVSLLVDALRSKGLMVEELNLLQSQDVPEDAAMVAILGPQKALLQREIFTLKDYLVDGGRLLLASDPQYSDNLNELSSLGGIVNDKNYLLVTQTIAGGDAMSVLGQDFDKESPITSKMREGTLNLFYEASSLTKSSTQFSVTKLVGTQKVVIPVKSLQTYQEEIKGRQTERANLAMLAKGSFQESAHEGHDHGKDASQDFLMAVFGDSDFLTDVYLETVFNKDLALNTFAELSGQTNLISIRPRTAKDTKLVLTKARSAFVMIFPILIPLILLMISAILWFRRRGA